MQVRQAYWDARRVGDALLRLSRPENRAFRKVTTGDYLRWLTNGRNRAIASTEAHTKAAIGWLCRAQDRTADDGVSYGYFPCRASGGWLASYPETTGYIITTMLSYRQAYGGDELLDRALRMARWEAEIQMDNGAVQGGILVPAAERTAATFNTGMVLDGWSEAYRASGDSTLLDAARKAADFLVGDLTEDGYFRSNGDFVTQDEVKLYNCLCGWALYRIGQDLGEARYVDTAVKVAEAAVAKQLPNGWFADNCLTDPAAPLLHTIGYTLQGVLEVGLLAGRDDLVEAARKGAEPMLAHVREDGFIPGRFDRDWRPAVRWSCLTGSAQLAIVCFRLGHHVGDDRFVRAANKLVDMLKATQRLESEDEGVAGAIAGSFPMFGGYMAGGYPNWATKYFVDALLLQAGHPLLGSMQPRCVPTQNAAAGMA